MCECVQMYLYVDDAHKFCVLPLPHSPYSMCGLYKRVQEKSPSQA